MGGCRTSVATWPSSRASRSSTCDCRSSAGRAAPGRPRLLPHRDSRPAGRRRPAPRRTSPPYRTRARPRTPHRGPSGEAAATAGERAPLRWDGDRPRRRAPRNRPARPGSGRCRLGPRAGARRRARGARGPRGGPACRRRRVGRRRGRPGTARARGAARASLAAAGIADRWIDPAWAGATRPLDRPVAGTAASVALLALAGAGWPGTWTSSSSVARGRAPRRTPTRARRRRRRRRRARLSAPPGGRCGARPGGCAARRRARPAIDSARGRARRVRRRGGRRGRAGRDGRRTGPRRGGPAVRGRHPRSRQPPGRAVVSR